MYDIKYKQKKKRNFISRFFATRRIRKARKLVEEMDVYLVHEITYLRRSDDMEIKARSFFHALQKYVDRLERKYKERHRLHDCYAETSSEWGRVKVINLRTGYKLYYM